MTCRAQVSLSRMGRRDNNSTVFLASDRGGALIHTFLPPSLHWSVSSFPSGVSGNREGLLNYLKLSYVGISRSQHPCSQWGPWHHGAKRITFCHILREQTVHPKARGSWLTPMTGMQCTNLTTTSTTRQSRPSMEIGTCTSLGKRQHIKIQACALTQKLKLQFLVVTSTWNVVHQKIMQQVTPAPFMAWFVCMIGHHSNNILQGFVFHNDDVWIRLLGPCELNFFRKPFYFCPEHNDWWDPAVNGQTPLHKNMYFLKTWFLTLFFDPMFNCLWILIHCSKKNKRNT